METPVIGRAVWARVRADLRVRDWMAVRSRTRRSARASVGVGVGWGVVWFWERDAVFTHVGLRRDHGHIGARVGALIACCARDARQLWPALRGRCAAVAFFE